MNFTSLNLESFFNAFRGINSLGLLFIVVALLWVFCIIFVPKSKKVYLCCFCGADISKAKSHVCEKQQRHIEHIQKFARKRVRDDFKPA